jgi:hypothetical protein
MPDCLRCGHHWDQRVVGSPVQCPFCKSPRWNTPRLADSPQVKPPAQKGTKPPPRPKRLQGCPQHGAGCGFAKAGGWVCGVNRRFIDG